MEVLIGPVSLSTRVRLGSSRDRNPGVGGSEFHALQLALIFMENKFKVNLMVEGIAPEMPSEIRLVNCKEAESLRDVILVTSVAAVVKHDLELFQSTRTVLVSHHPHDGFLSMAIKRLPLLSGVVNVGRYQFFSNRRRGIRSVWLPTFSPMVVSRNPELGKSTDYTPGQNLFEHHSRIGHISSLHASKGFHVALAGFLRHLSESRLEHVRFRVIGGSELYGDKSQTSSPIPVTEPSMTKIRKVLNRFDDLGKSSVDFLGVMKSGIPEEVSTWLLAIQNPLGFAEADPMSVQDCLAQSVPFIGSSLFGMYDYSTIFPELNAHTSRQVQKKLRFYLSHPELHATFRTRAMEAAADLSSRRVATEKLWVALIGDIQDGGFSASLDVGRIEIGLLFRLAFGVLLSTVFSSLDSIKKITQKSA